MQRNSDEVHAFYCEKLGPEFGDAYYFAFSEYSEIWLTWKQYKNLFFANSERIELLNKSGSAFFARVQRIFFEAVILGSCRLTDPKETRSKNGIKKNLTLNIFSNFLVELEHKEKFDLIMSEVKDATEFARDWRNRHISHSDYDIRSGVEQLQEATYNKVNSMIKSIFKIFLFVENDLIGDDLDEEIIDDLNNEMVLLHRLNLGVVEFQKMLDARVDPFLGTPDWLTS